VSAGRRWADLSLGRKGLVVIALPLLALVVAAGTFMWVERREDSSQTGVAETLRVRGQIQQVSQFLVDAETGVRGYLLTKDRSFLAPYREATEQLPATIDMLRTLVADNPGQSDRLDRVDQLAAEKFALTEDLAGSTGDLPPSGERNILLTESKSLQDELRAELEAMRKEETRLLEAQMADLDRTQTVALIVIVSGGLLGLLGGIVAMAIFTSGVVKRVQRVEDNARRIDQHEELLPLPPGDDEIGRLGRQIVATGEQLEIRRMELHEARTFLEELIERSPVVIFRRNPEDLTTTFVSSNVERMLGYAPQELTGDSDVWMERVHPDDVEAVTEQTRLGLAEGATHLRRPRFRWRHKDGHWVWLETVVRIEYVDGKPRDLFGYALDVTEQQETEDALAERELTLSAMLGTSPDVIVISDEAGARRYVSPSVADALGYSAEEALGGGPDVVHPEDRRLAIEQLRRAISGPETVRARYRMLHADGHWVWLDVRARRLEMPGRERPEVISSMREVSAQVDLEDELRRAKEEAESSSRAKSDFLSRMSHELRTPLNAILGFAQILELEELGPQQRDSVGEILKGGRHLLDLINEVLDIARIETGRLGLSLEPVPVEEVVNESLGLVRPLAAQRKIEMGGPDSLDPSWHVMADRQRLKQVLLNLLSNAVKYNRSGGKVTIGCEAAGPDRLSIRVADTGPGIPKEQMDLLFSPFERLGAEYTGIEGTGLGLALSKVLVDAMGGAIDVESSAGIGTKFGVTLFRVDSPTVGSDLDELVVADNGAGPGARTLLYVEDNLSNLKLVEHILARRPELKLHAAMQGRLGLDLIREHRPDLVLLDLNLPDLPGAELLAILRHDPSTRDIPVVVISADATRHQIDRLTQAGARAYLTKPLDVKRFLDVVDELLEPGRSEEEVNASFQDADEST
jgi:PAS domain S-box-containing protein